MSSLDGRVLGVKEILKYDTRFSEPMRMIENEFPLVVRAPEVRLMVMVWALQELCVYIPGKLCFEVFTALIFCQQILFSKSLYAHGRSGCAVKKH